MQGAFCCSAGLTVRKERGEERIGRKASFGAFCPNPKFLAKPMGNAEAKFAR